MYMEKDDRLVRLEDSSLCMCALALAVQRIWVYVHCLCLKAACCRLCAGQSGLTTLVLV